MRITAESVHLGDLDKTCALIRCINRIDKCKPEKWSAVWQTSKIVTSHQLSIRLYKHDNFARKNYMLIWQYITHDVNIGIKLKKRHMHMYTIIQKSIMLTTAFCPLAGGPYTTTWGTKKYICVCVHYVCISNLSKAKTMSRLWKYHFCPNHYQVIGGKLALSGPSMRHSCTIWPEIRTERERERKCKAVPCGECHLGQRHYWHTTEITWETPRTFLRDTLERKVGTRVQTLITQWTQK